MTEPEGLGNILKETNKNKVVKKCIYRIDLDFETVYAMGQMITKNINDIIPDELFPRIEIKLQGVKRGTRFWSSSSLGQVLARQIAHYLKSHVILDQKEILEEE
jgi:hypothetical protein